MLPLVEILKLGEWVVFEGLDYEKFGFGVLSLSYWKDTEAENFNNWQKMNGCIQG